ncbi:MAG TPA: zf-HC2 domain-containing protein [Thermoanaerobaculia bacterium]|nr:zf-HC2 domain-containing protein [Thermoanaerobaculia bacterium]
MPAARPQRLAARIVEAVDSAEQGMRTIEAALHDSHPAPARLGSFIRGELSREENRALVRHLLTGCPDCAALLRPLLGQAGHSPLRWGGATVEE